MILSLVDDGRPDDRPSIPEYVLLNQAPRLGRTARVYRAVSLADGSSAAVKVLASSLQQGDFLEEAFLRETQSLSELRHPNIVGMRGSGIAASGERYIVLDWIDSDLNHWRSGRGVFDWAAFWQTVGRPVASAVALAHAKGISHRDLAPRNILMTAGAIPMVADFGIAKLRRFMRSDQTLREFVSPPFTPPETDDGSGTPARDVFSLAALFCWCASSVELPDYAAVQSFATHAEELPSAVRQILREALSIDPGDRPALAEQLVDRLDLVCSSLAPRTALHCQLSIGYAQMDRICREFGLVDRSATESAILDDLHSACGIEPKALRDGSASAFGDLDVFGLTRSYHMKPDEMTHDRLVIVGARERPSGWLEQRREAAINPRMEFRFSPVSADADRRALATLQQTIDDHVHQREIAEGDAESRLFATWARILQVKQDVEVRRERPVKYTDFVSAERRVRFQLVGAIPEGAAMEKREIRLEDGSLLRGHLEDIEGDEATFVVSG